MGRFTDALKTEVGSYGDREWEGKIGETELKLFAQPLSPADVEKVRRKYPDFMSQPEPAAMVNIICDKAKDEEGNKAFAVALDGPLMKRMKVSAIGEIFQALFGDDFDDDTDFDGKVDTQKGNS